MVLGELPFTLLGASVLRVAVTLGLQTNTQFDVCLRASAPDSHIVCMCLMTQVAHQGAATSLTRVVDEISSPKVPFLAIIRFCNAPTSSKEGTS